MYDFFAKNSLYVVLAVAMVVWAGIAYYLFRLERAVKKLEEQTAAPQVGDDE